MIQRHDLQQTLSRVHGRARHALDQGRRGLGTAWTEGLHLDATYAGPILVADVDRTLDHENGVPDEPVFGSRKLLADADVPLVYVTEQRSPDSVRDFLAPYPSGLVVTGGVGSTPGHAMQAVLSELRQQYPQARLFMLGHDGGEDAQAAAAVPGTRAFLLNTDPTQSRIPAALKPIVTDQYSLDFQARVQAELKGDASVPAPPNPPPMPPFTRIDSLRQHLQMAGFMAAGVGDKLASWLARRTVNALPVMGQVSCASDQALSLESPQKLAEMADRLLLDRHIDSGERSRQIFRLLTAHGTEPGSVDAVQSRMRARDSVRSHLSPTERDALAALDKANAAVPGRWDLFESYLDRATLSRATDGNRIEVFIDGPAAYKAMLGTIAGANRMVMFNSHVLGSDQAGWEHADAMVAAAGRGAQVWAMYDEFGSSQPYHHPTRPNNPAFYRYMEDNGVHQYCHPAGALYGHLTHRKILTADQGDRLVGFVGGMNVANDHRNTWHDVQCRITGPAVTDLQQVLIDQWAEEGHPIPDDLQAQMLAPQAPVAEGGKARIIQHTGHRDVNMKLAYLRAIDTAEHTINIADPYFTDADVYEHLIAAARRGVQVQVFYPRHNLVKPTQDCARAWFPQMIDAGIKVFEYDGAPMSHGKVATFDGQYCTIGSSNLDGRSLLHNDECNVWSADASVAQDVDARFFGPDVAKSIPFESHKATLQERLSRMAAAVL